jgi:hypothetical protein
MHTFPVCYVLLLQVPTRFRRASQLRLGPLVLSDPVMLEMSISRIVGQFHEKVIGIVGKCTVKFAEMVPHRRAFWVFAGRVARNCARTETKRSTT